MQQDAAINHNADTPKVLADGTVGELRGIFAQVSRNTVWLVAMQLAVRAVGLLNILVLTRFLSVSSFGFYSLLLSFFAVADQVADLGLSRLMVRDLAREPSWIPRYAGVILPIKLVTTSVTYLGLLLVLRLSGYSAVLIALGAVGGLTLIPSGCVLVVRSLFHSQQRFVFDAFVQLLYIVVQLALGTVALLLGWGLEGVLWATIFATTVYFVVLVRGCWRRGFYFHLRLDFGAARRLVGQSLPYAGISLLTILSGRLEPIVLGRFGDPAALGLFGAAAKISDATLYLPMMLGLALTPIISRYHAESVSKLSAVFFWSTRALLFVVVPSAALVIVLAPWVVNLLFPTAFAGAAALLSILFIAQPLAAFNLLCGTILFSSDQQHRMVLVLAATTVVQLLVDLVFIPAFGAEGAAEAIVVVQAIGAIVMSFLLQRSFLRSGVLRRTLAPAGAGLVVMIGTAALLWSTASVSALLPASGLYLITFAVLHLISSTPERAVRR